jgi:hypothetical protein
MRHQIGMAKPYGLGSVKIIPTLILQNRENRYASLFDEGNSAWKSDVKDDSKKTGDQYKTIFAKSILNFCDIAEDKKLEDIPRLRELFVMLEWEKAKQSTLKEYLGLATRDEQTEWRSRYVLPHPSDVEGFETGTIYAPSTENQISTNSKRSDIEVQQAQQSRITSVMKQIGELQGEGKELKEKLREISNKILKKLSENSEEQKHVAISLMEKIRDLNAQDLVINSEWYPKIKRLAEDKN